MLLLLCDLHKALWYLIPAAVTLTSGPIAGQSTFCQGSGFMITYAIEACGAASAFLHRL